MTNATTVAVYHPATMTNCAGNCGVALPLNGANSCAILICEVCRSQPEKFRNIRARMFKHIKDHTIKARQTNPWYPFRDLGEAWDNA